MGETAIRPHFLNVRRILTGPKPIESAEPPLPIGVGLVNLRCAVRELWRVAMSLPAQVFVRPAYMYGPYCICRVFFWRSVPPGRNIAKRTEFPDKFSSR